MPDVRAALSKMKAFADQITAGQWLGFTEANKNIVNINVEVLTLDQ